MTTEQLRKEITVQTYFIRSDGITIQYLRSFKEKGFSEGKYIELNPEECARQLSAIGSIDSWESEVFLLNYENQQLHWLAFVNTFKLSQWEAFNLAFRHEAEKELEKDSNLLEMDRAIEALKNS